jgi:hypothetical protein
MTSRNPRIIVVDKRQALYQIVRSALDLMERRARLIHTDTAEDALLELRASGADLLVTAHILADGSDGPGLALEAKRELAALSVIVIADADDPDANGHDQALFHYLRRPFPPESFIRAIRISLDGPEAASHSGDTEADLIPVPEIDPAKLRQPLFQLMRDVGAMAVVLANRHGKVISYEGAAGYVDRDVIASVLGGSFHNIAKLLPIIGDQPRVLQYYDGDKRDLFALALGLHYFVMLIFEGNASAAALGNVKRFGFAVINDMLALVGSDVAFTTKPVAPPPTKVVTTKRATTELPRVRPPKAAPAPAAAPMQDAAPVRPAPEAEVVQAAPIPNFDPNIFEGLNGVDVAQADELFSPSAIAATLNQAGGPKISFEDAMMQGILGDLGETK